MEGRCYAPHVAEMQASILRGSQCQRSVIKTVHRRSKQCYPIQILKVNNFASSGTGTRRFCSWGLKLDQRNNWGAKSELFPSIKVINFLYIMWLNVYVWASTMLKEFELFFLAEFICLVIKYDAAGNITHLLTPPSLERPTHVFCLWLYAAMTVLINGHVPLLCCASSD